MASTSHAARLAACLIAVFCLLSARASAQDTAWKRHVIDDSTRGADGVRLADVNADGQLDITTGWEEGGVTRLYVHPDIRSATAPWPAVTVGATPSVEDAVFCDVDGDGAVDVVSSCEGKTRSIFVHWAPQDRNQQLQANAWKTEIIPAAAGVSAWMFALPQQVDAQNGIDLIVGSKGAGAMVGWLQAPLLPRTLADWQLHRLYAAGWIMSLRSIDLDDDGDLDLVVSDRKGKTAGVLWLENPGANHARDAWRQHRLGANGKEVMFLDVADLDGDGREDVVAAVKPDEIHCFHRPLSPQDPWTSDVLKVAHPAGIGSAKAVRVGDLDGDGRADIVYSCEQATPPARGVVWLTSAADQAQGPWSVRDISGPDGIKFDRIELIDLDGDGDLDVLTCEERHAGKGLGVTWYENPLGK